MSKKSYTLIVVPNTSSALHKFNIPLWAVSSVALAGVLAVGSVSALGFHYARMAVRAANYEQLVDDNASLRVANQNLEVSTEQLNTRIAGLEALTGQIREVMQADTWNQRFGLLEDGGVGGSVDDYPTTVVSATFNVRDHLEQARERTLELEGQLRSVESLVETRADKLELTPSIWPVSGSVRSAFGWRRDPFNGQNEAHHGLDIGALYGTPVHAPANGRVIFAGRQAAYGNLVVIDHGNGITTRYGHLSRFEVNVGDRLAKGELLAYVGSTGRSTGPHLHYEVRVDERAVNPRNYLPASQPSAD
jgi:murein DD-endopeptidase MepM/ murein hydrolase activator NlpD